MTCRYEKIILCSFHAEVKLKDYGSESIEVIDNGFGVEQRNFEGLSKTL